MIKVEKEDRQIVGEKIVAYGILENEVSPYCSHAIKMSTIFSIDNYKVTGIDDSPDLTTFLDTNNGR